jgi:hypothetical protein
VRTTPGAITGGGILPPPPLDAQSSIAHELLPLHSGCSFSCSLVLAATICSISTSIIIIRAAALTVKLLDSIRWLRIMMMQFGYKLFAELESKNLTELLGNSDPSYCAREIIKRGFHHYWLCRKAL